MHFGFSGRLRSHSSCYKWSFVKSEIKAEMPPTFNLSYQSFLTSHGLENMALDVHVNCRKKKSPTHFVTWHKLCWLRGGNVWFSSWGMPRHEMRDFLQQQVNGQRERATWNHGKQPARHKKPQLLAHLCNSATSKAESTCCKFWSFTSRWFHLLASPVLFEQGSKYQLHSLLHECVHEQLLSCWMNMCCVREQFNEKLRVNSVHSCKN